MNSEDLKVYGDYLAKAQTVPQNTSADGNGVELEAAGTNGAIEVVARAKTDISLADTKVLSVKVQDKASGGSYADLGTVGSVTASGATTITAGTVIGKFILPSDTEKLIKAVITTDDAAATGTIDVYPTYLAR